LKLGSHILELMAGVGFLSIDSCLLFGLPLGT